MDRTDLQGNPLTTISLSEAYDWPGAHHDIERIAATLRWEAHIPLFNTGDEPANAIVVRASDAARVRDIIHRLGYPLAGETHDNLI